jgi:crossover junction endodeoxyribonuclease RuvC
MRVLGIDPGTATTGYGVVEDREGELELLVCGVISTTPQETMPMRLRSIYRDLRTLIAQWAPDALAVEELFFSRNVTTALTVGQARGVVLLAGAEADLPIFEYKPAAVKQAIAGYGGADKQQVQQMVRLLLHLEQVPRPDDAADAVALAVCHHHSARFYDLVQA